MIGIGIFAISSIIISTTAFEAEDRYLYLNFTLLISSYFPNLNFI
jgi:hypothetical protein